MTIPAERTSALKSVREFLYSLMDRKRTPRIPMAIRRRARSLLKHYPGDYFIEETQKKLPKIWGEFKE